MKPIFFIFFLSLNLPPLLARGGERSSSWSSSSGNFLYLIWFFTYTSFVNIRLRTIRSLTFAWSADLWSSYSGLLGSARHLFEHDQSRTRYIYFKWFSYFLKISLAYFSNIKFCHAMTLEIKMLAFLRQAIELKR